MSFEHIGICLQNRLILGEINDVENCVWVCGSNYHPYPFGNLMWVKNYFVDFHFFI